MPKRTSLEDRLAALHALRDDPNTSESQGLIRRELGTKNAFVVAEAARIIGDYELPGFETLLLDVYERFLPIPAKTDPQCAAKTAIVGALSRLQVHETDFFISGIRYEQWEGAYGGPVDTAATLRGWCAMGLAQTGHTSAMRHIAGLLGDHDASARAHAIRAMLASGNDEAVAPLLRYKATIGDESAEVMSECFEALLEVDGEQAVAFVSEFLHGEVIAAECAAMALGNTRLGTAFASLRVWHAQLLNPGLRSVAALALALLRSDASQEYLLQIIRGESSGAAAEAIKALAIYKHDKNVRDRVEAALGKGDHVGAKEVFESSFDED